MTVLKQVYKCNVCGNIVEVLHTGAGDEFVLDTKEIALTDQSAGDWVAHRGWRVRLPEGSRFTWPAMPFNPYTVDGAAPIDEAAAILSVPLSGDPVSVILEIA